MISRIDIEDMTDAQDETPLTREQQIALMACGQKPQACSHRLRGQWTDQGRFLCFEHDHLRSGEESNLLVLQEERLKLLQPIFP